MDYIGGKTTVFCVMYKVIKIFLCHCVTDERMYNIGLNMGYYHILIHQDDRTRGLSLTRPLCRVSQAVAMAIWLSVCLSVCHKVVIVEYGQTIIVLVFSNQKWVRIGLRASKSRT